MHEWGELSNVCSITIFSSSILFYNVNNILKKFHKLQIYLNSYIHLAKQWSYVEFTLFCNKFTLKTTYDPRDIELKQFLSLKFNKSPKYEKNWLFKVCHIKKSQNSKVSNYTFGILGKLSMHRGAHWFCDISLEEKCHLQPIFATKNYHLQLYWQFLGAKIGYIYKKKSCTVWNHVTQDIEYWTFFSMIIELNQNENN